MYYIIEVIQMNPHYNQNYTRKEIEEVLDKIKNA